MPESEYSAFLQYKEMKDKHDYLSTFGVDTDEDIAKTLAMFGGFTEGLQLFASFAMLMNFPRFKDRKSTRLNSSHANISYAVFCLKKKKHRSNCPAHNQACLEQQRCG